MKDSLLSSDVIFKSVFIHNEDILNKFIYDITGYKFNKISLGMNELPIVRKKEVYLFMETVKRVTRYHHVMDEKEALELDNKIRRSLYAEGEEKGFSNGERIGFSNGFSNGEKIGFSNGFSDGIMSMIKAMIDNHIDIETISKVSNKSIDEIEKIIDF